VALIIAIEAEALAMLPLSASSSHRRRNDGSENMEPTKGRIRIRWNRLPVVSG
jgi:hypothetical protein